MLPARAACGRKRTIWAWVATAAVVLLGLIPFGYYQHGLAARHGQLAHLRSEVSDTQAVLARAEVDFRQETESLASLETGKALRLQITGPSVYHPEVENRYRVVAEDLDGNALTAKVEARSVDGANNELFRSEELPIRGERVVILPAKPEVPPWAKTRLEIRAGAGKLTEEMTRCLLLPRPTR